MFRVVSIFLQNPESTVLLSSGLWATVAALHPAQILKLSAFDNAGNTPCPCKTNVLYKKNFFFGLGHVPVMRPLGK